MNSYFHFLLSYFNHLCKQEPQLLTQRSYLLQLKDGFMSQRHILVQLVSSARWWDLCHFQGNFMDYVLWIHLKSPLSKGQIITPPPCPPPFWVRFCDFCQNITKYSIFNGSAVSPPSGEFWNTTLHMCALSALSALLPPWHLSHWCVSWSGPRGRLFPSPEGRRSQSLEVPRNRPAGNLGWRWRAWWRAPRCRSSAGTWTGCSGRRGSGHRSVWGSWKPPSPCWRSPACLWSGRTWFDFLQPGNRKMVSGCLRPLKRYWRNETRCIFDSH